MALPIQIPKPCHEDWQQMTPEDKGRHCLVCQKTVIDFTQLTDTEILSYFQQKPTGVCGRFRPEQLAPKPVAEVTQTSRWKMYLMALSATFALKTMLTETAKAQTPVEQREPQITPPRVGTVAYVHDEEQFTISGKVIDADTKEAIPGVSIAIKGTTQGTNTNANGEFKFVQFKKGDTLVVSLIGYVTQEHKVQSEQLAIIKMSPDVEALSTMVVVGYGEVYTDKNLPIKNTRHVPLHKRVCYRVKSWFQ